MILNSKEQQIWFTSDTHFGHKNILEYCPKTRQGNSIEEHDKILIQNWNNQVGDNDLVFHLGDVAFAKHDTIWNILNTLKGNIYLIKGNHDRKIENSKHLQKRFEGIFSDLTLYIDNQMVVLYHYPIAEHNQLHRGSFHFHGHVHGGAVPGIRGRVFDVGIDNRFSNDMKLWSWEELKEILSKVDYGERTH